MLGFLIWFYNNERLQETKQQGYNLKVHTVGHCTVSVSFQNPIHFVVCASFEWGASKLAKQDYFNISPLALKPSRSQHRISITGTKLAQWRVVQQNIKVKQMPEFLPKIGYWWLHDRWCKWLDMELKLQTEGFSNRRLALYSLDIHLFMGSSLLCSLISPSSPPFCTTCLSFLHPRCDRGTE